MTAGHDPLEEIIAGLSQECGDGRLMRGDALRFERANSTSSYPQTYHNMISHAMLRRAAPSWSKFVVGRSYATVTKNAPLAAKLKINGDRLWYASSDSHH